MYTCHEQCQYEPLLYKGNRYTEVGARYCSKCERYYLPEYGSRCKCCFKKLRSRLKCTGERWDRYKEYKMMEAQEKAQKKAQEEELIVQRFLIGTQV